jgi:hypothetical protein
MRQDLAHFPFVYHAKENAHQVAGQEDEEDDDDWDSDSDNDSMILGTTPHVSSPPSLHNVITTPDLDQIAPGAV